MINAQYFLRAAVKQLEDNSIAFYPFGMWGAGRVVPSETEFWRIAKLVAAGNLIAVPIAILLFFTLPGYSVFIFLLLLIIGSMLLLNAKVKHWQPVSEKLRYSDLNKAPKSRDALFWLLFLLWFISVFVLLYQVHNLLITSAPVSYQAMLVAIIMCAILWVLLSRAGVLDSNVKFLND